jgi:hypothetical protein
MTTLPPELAPWAPLLAGVADELVADLARLARRLDAAIGPLRPRLPERGGEPDGYRGLDRRGPYDRLLLSEWAMLDVAPDEFVRRAAAREHAFYALDHRSPRGGLRCHATLDAGPDQLGTPRIAHLALLVALARRAEAAGAAFTWEVAQRPGLVHDNVDRATLAALLAGRSGEPFRAPPPPQGAPPDERWLIGGPAVRGVAGTIAAVIDDVVEPDRDEVLVHVERAGRAPVTVTLPLPPVAARRRLVTDPFVPVRVPRPSRAREASDAEEWRPFPHAASRPAWTRWIPNTAQLFCGMENGWVFAWSFANVDTRKVPKPQALLGCRAPARVAVGYHQQRFLDVGLDEGIVVTGRRLRFSVAAPRRPVPGVGPAVGLGPDVLFVDGEGTLWRAGAQKLEPVFEQVRGLWAAAEYAIALTPGNLLRVGPGPGLVRLPEGSADALLVAGWFGAYEPGRVVYREAGEMRCRGFGTQGLADKVESIPAPAGEVVGAAGWLDPIARAQVWGVVTWEAERGRFVRHPDGAVLVVPRAPRPGAAVSPDGSMVAFLTAEGTLEVWRFDRSAPVLLRHGGDTP